MDMSEDSMKLLQDHQFAIAAEIRRICHENDIKFFIIAGTLLGAVRHQGFIPWDDDMDIGMLRSEYEKFLACAAEQLPEQFVLQTWHHDAGFGLPMAKVRQVNTRLVERNSINARDQKGIFVDIFPFDEIPPSLLKRKLQNASTFALKRLILAKLSYDVGAAGSVLKKALFGVLVSLTKHVSVRRMIAILEHEMQKYNHSQTGDFVAIGGSYGYQKEIIQNSWVQELTEVNFEKLSWPCFRQWDAYLEHMYGDYMQLPPIDQRGKRHGIVEISFHSP
jgi:lipopolysaccharide cholinephosphotransferase